MWSTQLTCNTLVETTYKLDCVLVFLIGKYVWIRGLLFMKYKQQQQQQQQQQQPQCLNISLTHKLLIFPI
jgi:hypothetical protein